MTTTDLPARERVAAIDAMRGLTILLMVFVNHLAGVTGLPHALQQVLHHMPADADAMSLADAVFPAFLFIVGMSIPFALGDAARVASSGAGHVLGRSLGLIVLGVFMVNAEEGFDVHTMPLPIAAWSLLVYASAWGVWGDASRLPARLQPLLRPLGLLGFLLLTDLYRAGPGGTQGLTHQWWGILGLIGWAYLCTATVWLAFGRRLLAALGGAVACTAVFAACSALDGRLAPGWSGLLGEGGAIGEAAITFLGLATALILLDPARRSSAARRRVEAALLAGALVAAGLALRPFYGISKIGATPPWCFFSAAGCIALFMGLQALIAWRGPGAWTRALQPVAAQPLVAYLLPFVLGAVMELAHLDWPAALRQGPLGFLTSLAFAAAVLAVTPWVTRAMRLRL